MTGLGRVYCSVVLLVLACVDGNIIVSGRTSSEIWSLYMSLKNVISIKIVVMCIISRKNIRNVCSTLHNQLEDYSTEQKITLRYLCEVGLGL